jgi:hypothetical protein
MSTPDRDRVIDAEFVEDDRDSAGYPGRNSAESRGRLNSRANSYPDGDSSDDLRGAFDGVARDVEQVRGAFGRIASRGRGILAALSKHVGEERRPFLKR